jgi:hypothetical protein
MDSMLDSIMGSLQTSGGIGQISESLGLDQNDVSKVMSGALPALLGGLTRNTSSVEGASGLLAALDRDHDGSILDDITGLLVTAGTAKTGAGILGHVFGDQQARVETALSKTTGVDAAMVGKIMAMVAPLVLGYLGRQRRQESLDVAGMVSLLTQERQIAEERSPQAVDMLSRLIDSDDDGTIVDDIAQMGMGALGSLFKT